MKEQALGARLARALDPELADLDPAVLRGLATARDRALGQLHATEEAGSLEWAANGAARMPGRPSRSVGMRRLLPIAVLVGGLCAAYWWQHTSRSDDGDEIELLSGELPVQAYLDQDFDQWLASSSGR